MAKVVKANEPRTHLANERTYLNWMSTNVQIFLLGVAIASLVESDLARAVALLFSSIAVCCSVYSGLCFMWRARGHFFNDRWGPVVLAGFVVMAMVFTAVLIVITGSTRALRLQPAQNNGTQYLISPRY